MIADSKTGITVAKNFAAWLKSSSTSTHEIQTALRGFCKELGKEKLLKFCKIFRKNPDVRKAMKELHLATPKQEAKTKASKKSSKSTAV